MASVTHEVRFFFNEHAYHWLCRACGNRWVGGSSALRCFQCDTQLPARGERLSAADGERMFPAHISLLAIAARAPGVAARRQLKENPQ